MIINSNFLFNCVEDTDAYNFEFKYKATYDDIQLCLENGTVASCEFVCKEFRFAGVSDMFIGQLEDYLQYLKNFEHIASKLNPDINLESNEIVITDEELSGFFFNN